MARYEVLKNRFLKNILILIVVVVVALISFNMFYITPSFTRLLINTTQHDAVRITRHLASSLLVSEKTEIGKDSLNTGLLKEVGKLKADFELMNLKVFSATGEIIFSGDPKEVGEINQRKVFPRYCCKRESLCGGCAERQGIPGRPESHQRCAGNLCAPHERRKVPGRS